MDSTVGRTKPSVGAVSPPVPGGWPPAPYGHRHVAASRTLLASYVTRTPLRTSLRAQDMKDVNEMAAPLTIETESGNCTGKRNRHNGYYAGDFSAVPPLPHSRLTTAMMTVRGVPE